MDCHCATKRKAEEVTDCLWSCATKRKLEVPKTDDGGDGDDGVEAPVREQVIRLPHEEIDRILTRPMGPGTVEDPEDCEDEDTKELLRENLEAMEAHWEEYSKYQDWVRREYAAKGFVEVEADYFTRREKTRLALSEDFDRMIAEYRLLVADFNEENDPTIDDMI
jgi:hypothetical protein